MEAAGKYRVEVRKLVPHDRSNGAYEARLVEVRPATPEELARHATENHLAQLEKQWDDAVTHRDTTVLARLMADDFLYYSEIGSGGNQGKSERLDEFVLAKKPSDKDGIAYHDVVDTTVRVFGDTAVISGKTTNTTRAGRKSDFNGRFIHVWQKRAGAWQLIADHFYPTDPVPAVRTEVAIDESLYAATWVSTSSPMAKSSSSGATPKDWPHRRNGTQCPGRCSLYQSRRPSSSPKTTTSKSCSCPVGISTSDC